MTQASLPLPQRRFGITARRDRWWITPVVVFSSFQRSSSTRPGPRSRASTTASDRTSRRSTRPSSSALAPAWFGPKPGWWPGWLPFSPALLILLVPAASASPATTTAAPTTRRSGPIRRPAPSASRGTRYSGRASFPLDPPEHPSLLPVPRAGRSSSFWRYDVVEGALVHRSGDRRDALRHRRRHPRARAQRRPARRLHVRLPLAAPPRRRHPRPALAATRCGARAYACVSCLNRRHMLWAWVSLFWVAFADLYVRLCSMGIWTDWRIL